MPRFLHSWDNDARAMANISVQTIPSQVYFCIGQVLTLPEIRAFVEEATPSFMKRVASLNLVKCGPVEYHYRFDGNRKSKFTLEIAQPVEKAGACSDPYYFKRSPEFKCASQQHRGSIRSIGQDWDFFAEHVQKAGYQPSGENREVYRYWESFESYRNITELQFGIT